MLEKAADYVALDLETTGLNPREDMICLLYTSDAADE